jgi:hypothetical protein
MNYRFGAPMLALACLILLSGLARAAEEKPATPPEQKQDGLSAVIDLLAEKGLITDEEQAELKKRAEQTPKPAPPEAPKPTYPTLKTKVRLQARWSAVEEDTGQPYFGERDDQAGGDGFAVRRARLYFLGQLNPQVGYNLQYQADNGTEDANLHVAQIEWKGWDFANLVAGQLQTPFGYEIVICDADMCLTDRSAVSDFLPPDKDIGIRLDSKRPILGGLNYQLFLGNGSGKFKANPNDGYLWEARLGGKPTPQLSVAASYSDNRNTDFSPYQSRFLKKNGDPYSLLPDYTAASVDETSWGADFQYERHPLTLWGEYASTRIAPGTKPAIRSDGYYLDAGCFIPYRGRRDKVQLVAGYQKFDANTSVTDKYDMTAWTLGVNYHIAPKFQHMVRAYYMWVNEKADPVDNNKLVVQYQLWF